MVLIWVFYDNNPNNFNFSIFGTIWFYKFLICTVCNDDNNNNNGDNNNVYDTICIYSKYHGLILHNKIFGFKQLNNKNTNNNNNNDDCTNNNGWKWNELNNCNNYKMNK